MLLALALTLAGALWANWQSWHAKDLADPDRARRQGRPIPVRTERVVEVDTEQVIGATALTFASDMAFIRLGGASNGFRRTDVVITAVHAHEGDYVEKDQLLFDIRDTVYRAALVQSQSALDAAEAQLVNVRKQIHFNQQLAEQGLETAKAELEYRQKNLEVRKKEVDISKNLVDKNSLSLIELLNTLALYNQAAYDQKATSFQVKQAEVALEMVQLKNRAELTRAESEVEAARTDVAAARRDVERCRVRSPLAGFVTQVDIVPGQVMEIFGNSSPLTSVLKLDPIHVRLDFPQERIDELAVGQKARVELDSFPQESFEGVVIRISPQVKPDLRVLPVTVEVRNSNNRIRAGISGFARLHVRKVVKAIPAQAVLRQGAEAAVFCVEEGRARLRLVRVGDPVGDGLLEVRDGLTKGEEVVIYLGNIYKHSGDLTRHDSYLQDNDAVDVNWRRWTRRE
jgi:multidrug resistance efflux pump